MNSIFMQDLFGTIGIMLPGKNLSELYAEINRMATTTGASRAQVGNHVCELLAAGHDLDAIIINMKKDVIWV